MSQAAYKGSARRAPKSGGSAAVAAVLSFIFPGLGHAYLGRRREALTFAVPVLVLFTILGVWVLSQGFTRAGAKLLDPTFAALAAILSLVLVVWWAAGIISAYRAGRQGDRATVLVPIALVLTLLMITAAPAVPLGAAWFWRLSASDQSAVRPQQRPIYRHCHGDAQHHSGTRPDADSTGHAGSGTNAVANPDKAARLCRPVGRSGRQRPARDDHSGDCATDRHHAARRARRRLAERADHRHRQDRGAADPHRRAQRHDDRGEHEPARPARSTCSASRATRPTFRFTTAERTTASSTPSPVTRRTIPGSTAAAGQALTYEIGFLLGMPIDYYASVNMDGFQELVDEVGGVTVCNSHDLNDEHLGFNLSAGLHTLNGADALRYARSRHGMGGSDFARARRQQQLLTAIRNQITAARQHRQPAEYRLGDGRRGQHRLPARSDRPAGDPRQSGPERPDRSVRLRVPGMGRPPAGRSRTTAVRSSF